MGGHVLGRGAGSVRRRGSAGGPGRAGRKAGEVMSEVEVIEAVRKEVVVPGPVERAFRIFTEGLGTWWPLLTHSVGAESAESVTMDCRQGGRIVELVADGTEHVWGTITQWDPPERVAFT